MKTSILNERVRQQRLISTTDKVRSGILEDRIRATSLFTLAKHKGLKFMLKGFKFNVEKVILTHEMSGIKQVFSGQLQLLAVCKNGDLVLKSNEGFTVRLPIHSNRITSHQFPEWNDAVDKPAVKRAS